MLEKDLIFHYFISVQYLALPETGLVEGYRYQTSKYTDRITNCDVL